MDTLHALILIGVLGLTSGVGVLPDSVNAAVGDTVMFTTSLSPTQTPFISITWQFGTKNIITSNVANITNQEYKDRITLFISTGSLELRNVTYTDEGTYTVTIIPEGSEQVVGTTTLNVKALVSNVSVTVNDTDLVELVSSVSLSCFASGSSLSFLWLNHSSAVTDNDRVHLTDGGSTLTIAPVTHYDLKQFECKVSNPVSSSTSEPIHLHINYGPYNIQVKGQTNLYAGQENVLVCLAESVPPARFSWKRNSETIGSDSLLFKPSITPSDAGEYTCEAVNSVTGKKMTKEHTLSVIETAISYSEGAVAGIAIACMVVVGVTVGVSVHFYHRNK